MSVHPCLQHVFRDAARGAGSSATAAVHCYFTMTHRDRESRGPSAAAELLVQSHFDRRRVSLATHGRWTTIQLEVQRGDR